MEPIAPRSDNRSGMGTMDEGGTPGEGDDADLPALGSLVGRYVVDAPLGRGAMGIVVRAYDPELDRTVALKLLRVAPAGDAQAARARMLREAQAMARVSHPNIVRVHDVGTIGERVFVAMDLIEGVTLRQWKSEPRRLAEILAVFTAAGQGLAAAHDVGLVHRDFKPDNVLIDARDGVFVTDFGLVRIGAPTRRVAPRPVVAIDGAQDEVTGVGTIVGTPAYMAPEQLEGGEVDERSDQFSFCVALYEAAYGARPFQGGSIDRLVSAVMRGELTPPPAAARVPSWLRALLLRGLAKHPGDRFDSMHALLHELRMRPRRRRIAAWALGTTAAASLALALGSWSRERPCQRLPEVAEIGDRDRIAAALGAASPAYARAAEDALAGVDAWLQRWTSTREQLCRATFVKGERSHAGFELATTCLDDRRADLDALLAVIGDGGAATASSAALALARLPEPSGCASVPAHPQPRSDRRAELSAVRSATLLRAAILPPPTAARTDDPELQLATLIHRATLSDERERWARAALALGESVALDDAVAQAWRALVAALADPRRTAELERAVRLAHAAVARAGDDPRAHAEIDRVHADALLAADRVGEALALHRRAATTVEHALGAAHVDVATALLALGRSLAAHDEPQQALAVELRALAIVEDRLGPDHPIVGTVCLRLATTLDRMGDAAAIEHRRRGLALLGGAR